MRSALAKTWNGPPSAASRPRPLGSSRRSCSAPPDLELSGRSLEVCLVPLRALELIDALPKAREEAELLPHLAPREGKLALLESELDAGLERERAESGGTPVAQTAQRSFEHLELGLELGPGALERLR